MKQEAEQEKILDPDSWSGKTSPELSAQTEAQTSEQSCKKRSTSQSNKPPMFLCLSKDGHWQDASTVKGGGFSISWRVFDAQFWGVPQRRRRIALVADFGGLTAPEILFERESVSGDIAASGAPRETAPRSAEDSSEAAVAICIQGNCIDRADTAGCNGRGWTEDVSYTLNTIDRPAVLPVAPVSFTNRGADGNGATETLRAQSHGAIPMVGRYAIGNGQVDGTGLHKVCGTLNCMHDQQALMLFENHGQDSRLTGPLDVSPTVSQKYGTGGNNTPLVCSEGAYGIDRAAFNQGQNALYRPAIERELQPTLTAKGPGAVAAVDCRNATEGDVNGTMQAKADGGFSYNCNQVVRTGYAVRRLTPLECERLQGFPDSWTDIGDWVDNKGKSHKISDANRYKALGNSIAIPSWFYVLQRLSVCCIDITMASLFDGIGGFPLIWETLHGKGSCLWASEIEEFPIAVTRFHFPEQ